MEDVDADGHGDAGKGLGAVSRRGDRGGRCCIARCVCRRGSNSRSRGRRRRRRRNVQTVVEGRETHQGIQDDGNIGSLDLTVVHKKLQGPTINAARMCEWRTTCPMGTEKHNEHRVAGREINPFDRKLRGLEGNLGEE